MTQETDSTSSHLTEEQVNKWAQAKLQGSEPQYEDDHVGNPLGSALLCILIMAATIALVVVIATLIPKEG